MTNPTEAGEGLKAEPKVTQADRDAAEAHNRGIFTPGVGSNLVEAFARHRAQSIAPYVEALRAAREGFASIRDDRNSTSKSARAEYELTKIDALLSGQQPVPDEVKAEEDETKLREWARKVSIAFTAVSGGGSEMFTRIGDEFYADPEACRTRVEEKLRTRLNTPTPTEVSALAGEDDLAKRAEAIALKHDITGYSGFREEILPALIEALHTPAPTEVTCSVCGIANRNHYIHLAPFTEDYHEFAPTEVSALAGDEVLVGLHDLRETLQRVADRHPDEQPHYPSGMRLFGTGDLRHLIAVLDAAQLALRHTGIATDELVEALKPFAEALDDWGDEPEQDDRRNLYEHPAAIGIGLGDLRRASAAIAKLREGVPLPYTMIRQYND